MPNYNKTILMGHLTRDPELRDVGNTTVASFGLAVNEKWKDKNGEQQERVMFIDCAAWGRTAEVIAERFNKGDAIFIEGKLRLETWDDKNGGGKRSKHSINVESFSFVGGSKGEGEGGGYSRHPKATAKAPANDIDHDDIPF